METLAQHPTELHLQLAMRILAAALLGAAIGLEREMKDHSAGLRTNMIVAIAACLFTMLSIYAFPSPNSDPARIAAQIVSGISFLGAGVVFQDQDKIRGLTTAATLWLVAAVGMAAGSGQFFIATIATIVTLVILLLLRPLEARLPRIGRGTPLRPHDDEQG